VTDRARAVFLGTGAFAVPVLGALAAQPLVDLVAVVTAPQRLGSRGRPAEPPVALAAAQHDVPMIRPERLRAADSVAQLAALSPDLLVLADYGQIVPGDLLDLPRHGALNLHPSLLPRHRGATPIPSAILEGDAETGVTLMRMDQGLDTGPIVAQWRHGMTGRETAPELEEALALQAARLLDATLGPWLAGSIEPQPQEGSGATLTRPLRRSDGRLDPMRPALELERQVRAYQPWPGSYLETESGRLAIWRASVGGARNDAEVGLLLGEGDRLALATADGLLALDEVQPAGGRRMTGAELLRGRPGLAGSSIAVWSEPGTP
jgi:methionyl-tRNA formyltransferase